MFFLDICSAVSRMVAEPLPLSLMPGPSTTESRCAPTTTVRPLRPVGVSAITLYVGRVSLTVEVVTLTTTSPALARFTNSSPAA